MVIFHCHPTSPRPAAAGSPGTKYSLGDSDEVVLGFLMMMAVIIGTGVGLCLGTMSPWGLSEKPALRIYKRHRFAEGDLVGIFHTAIDHVVVS